MGFVTEIINIVLSLPIYSIFIIALKVPVGVLIAALLNSTWANSVSVLQDVNMMAKEDFPKLLNVVKSPYKHTGHIN